MIDIIFLYLGKFVGHALHDLHALTACHWSEPSINIKGTFVDKFQR